MATTVLDGLDEVRAAVGRDLGTTAWVAVTPEQVDRFERATGAAADRPDALGADGPGTGSGDRTAPPYLVLGLTNLLLPRLLEVRGVSAGVNYGTDRVRFPAPVPVPGRVRGRAELVACTEIPDGVQTTVRITVEVDGTGRGTSTPEAACVVDSLSRWLLS